MFHDEVSRSYFSKATFFEEFVNVASAYCPYFRFARCRCHLLAQEHSLKKRKVGAACCCLYLSSCEISRPPLIRNRGTPWRTVKCLHAVCISLVASVMSRSSLSGAALLEEVVKCLLLVFVPLHVDVQAVDQVFFGGERLVLKEGHKHQTALISRC